MSSSIFLVDVIRVMFWLMLLLFFFYSISQIFFNVNWEKFEITDLPNQIIKFENFCF